MKKISFLLFIIFSMPIFSSCTALSEFSTSHVHEYTEKIINESYMKSEATCQHPATYYYSCECGEVGTDTFEVGETKLHNFCEKVVNEMYLKSEATCKHPATYYYSCECGEVGTDTFEVEGTESHNFCKQVVNELYLNSEATCQHPATYYYSCECGEVGTTIFSYGPTKEHVYKAIKDDRFTARIATCQSPATYYYSCECGDINNETFEGDELGNHSFIWFIAEEKYLRTLGNCQKPSTYYLSCECGAMSADYFELDHNEPHKYTETVVSNIYLKQKATCQNVASYYYSCICGATGTESFESGKIGSHKYTEKVINETYLVSEATCQHAATYYYSCKCGKKGNKTFTDGISLPHDIIEENKISIFNTPYKFLECKYCDYYDIEYNSSLLLSEYKSYASQSMYKSFDLLDNKDKLKDMYHDVLSNSLIFTFDYDVNLEDDKVFSINYSEYGLSFEEGASVWSAIESDWPLFYWLSNTIYASTTIDYMTIEDYRIGTNREYYNEVILNGINNLTNTLKDKSVYQQLYYLHNEIIINTDYAYDNFGKPSDNLSAHSILGYFNHENVVCEGYAKTVQIILNLLGIENLYVTGDAGEPHAWNMVKLYNEWFLLDLTWDDLGYQYIFDYFLTYDDGTHLPYNNELGFHYQYSVPELSDNYFQPVTLYKEDELVDIFSNFDTALSSINDPDGVYTIYLYDETITYYETWMDYNYGLNTDNMPICQELSLIAHSDSKVDVLFTTNLPDKNILTCDIYLQNISFPDPTLPENRNITPRYIDLNGHCITFDNCGGGLYYIFYGEESSQINAINCSGPYNTDSIMFLCPVKIDKYYTSHSDAEILNDFIVNEIELDGCALTIANHSEDNQVINFEINQFYSNGGSIYIRYNGNANGTINISIDKYINYGIYSGIMIMCSENYESDTPQPYPNITINEHIGDKLEFNIYDLSIEKFMEVKNKLLYINTQSGLNLFYDGDISETLLINENGFVSSTLEYQDGFLFSNGVLYKYLLNELAVIIPDHITEIKGWCFDCKAMLSLTIPESLIKPNHFFINRCLRLTEIINKSNIPNETLLSYMDWDSSKSIVFVDESKLNITDDFVFTNKNGELVLIAYVGNEVNINLPELDETYCIGNSLFYDNQLIKSVTIPSCVTKIGAYAFARTQLKEITIPEGVIEIGDFAFNEMEFLQKLYLPSTIEKIGYLVFSWTDNLKVLEMVENNYYCVKNNSLFEKNTKTVLKGIKGASIPSDTEIIAEYAYYNVELSDWTLPNTLKEIHPCALDHTNITSIVIPESVIVLESGFSMTPIEKIEFLCNIESITGGMFFHCENLKEITLPSTIKTIKNQAFQNCYNLETIVINKDIEEIGQYVFTSCYNLKNVYYMGTKEEWDKINFKGTDSNPLAFATNFYVYIDGEFVLQY